MRYKRVAVCQINSRTEVKILTPGAIYVTEEIANAAVVFESIYAVGQIPVRFNRVGVRKRAGRIVARHPGIVSRVLVSNHAHIVGKISYRLSVPDTRHTSRARNFLLWRH